MTWVTTYIATILKTLHGGKKRSLIQQFILTLHNPWPLSPHAWPGGQAIHAVDPNGEY